MHILTIQLTPDELRKLAEVAAGLATTPTAIVEALVCDVVDSTRKGGADEQLVIGDWLARNQTRLQRFAELEAQRPSEDVPL